MKEATITRVFDLDAPRDVVWLYFTEPEYFAEWFGHEPFTTPVSEVTYHKSGHLPDDQYPLIEQGVSGFYERLAEHVTRQQEGVA